MTALSRTLSPRVRGPEAGASAPCRPARPAPAAMPFPHRGGGRLCTVVEVSERALISRENNGPFIPPIDKSLGYARHD